MRETTARIFDIARGSCVDGPGLRTAVFFKGCSLRCAWCHNPESHSFAKQVLFYEARCSRCGRCRDAAPDDWDFRCEREARVVCGQDYTPRQLLEVIRKDRLFYEGSGGGVTFTGGECMLQTEALAQSLRLCREAGIHTAVDTAGHVPYASFAAVLAYTDLFLYDVKCMDPRRHRQYTGADNRQILDNLKKLLQQQSAAVWVRIPVIPGFNDTPEEMVQIRSFLQRWGMPQRVELLPYHAMAEHKYAALGAAPPRFSVPEEQTMQRLRQCFEP